MLDHGQSASGDQLSILPALDPFDLIREARDEHQPIASFCLFSGGNDSTVLAHACRDEYDELVFIDTGTAVPGVREFVEEYAAWIDKPLRIYDSGDAYRRMVLGDWKKQDGTQAPALGFPGPAQHGRAYIVLKERRLADLVREAKRGHPRTATVMLLSGVRRAESSRRGDRAPMTRDGGKLFVNPLIDWSNSQMREYRQQHGLPQSDVAALLHRSGECNCGAFAAPGEREDLQQFYPQWFEENIAALEREAEARGIHFCKWGQRHRDDAPEDAGAMCSDCQLRLAA